jgi:hypothetical protein
VGVWVKPNAIGKTGIAATHHTETAKKDEKDTQKSGANQGITLTQVLLNNQADISVFYPMLLQIVRPNEKR